MSAGWNCVTCPYLNQSHTRVFRPPVSAHHNHTLWLGSISADAQSGIQEEGGHLNKIRTLFGMRKRDGNGY